MKKILILILCTSLFFFTSCFVTGKTSDVESNVNKTSNSGTSSNVCSSSNIDVSSNVDDSPNVNDSSDILYYTVIFNSKGGSKIENVRVKCGSKLCKPDNPTRTSTSTVEYEFLGWFYNGVEWDFDSEPVLSDMELVAKWKEVNYTGDLPIRR